MTILCDITSYTQPANALHQTFRLIEGVEGKDSHIGIATEVYMSQRTFDSIKEYYGKRIIDFIDSNYNFWTAKILIDNDILFNKVKVYGDTISNWGSPF